MAKHVQTQPLLLGGYEATVWDDEGRSHGKGVDNTKEKAIDKAIKDYKLNKD